jgi:hypothetical protein
VTANGAAKLFITRCHAICNALYFRIQHSNPTWRYSALVVFVLFIAGLVYRASSSKFRLNQQLRNLSSIGFWSIAGTTVLAPPTTYAINHVMALIRHQPREKVTFEELLATALTYLTVLATTITVIFYTDAPQAAAGVAASSEYESYYVVDGENDLLNLDQSRFMENGFGGLYPGQVRKT